MGSEFSELTDPRLHVREERRLAAQPDRDLAPAAPGDHDRAVDQRECRPLHGLLRRECLRRRRLRGLIGLGRRRGGPKAGRIPDRGRSGPRARVGRARSGRRGWPTAGRGASRPPPVRRGRWGRDPMSACGVDEGHAGQDEPTHRRRLRGCCRGGQITSRARGELSGCYPRSCRLLCWWRLRWSRPDARSRRSPWRRQLCRRQLWRRQPLVRQWLPAR
jgi:hypothetical protein